nr:hypothetical protein [Tanacetum cinerariifolium]
AVVGPAGEGRLRGVGQRVLAARRDHPALLDAGVHPAVAGTERPVARELADRAQFDALHALAAGL